jgi:hypothetical protein
MAVIVASASAHATTAYSGLIGVIQASSEEEPTHMAAFDKDTAHTRTIVRQMPRSICRRSRDPSISEPSS